MLVPIHCIPHVCERKGGRPSGLQWMLSTALKNADSVLAHECVYLDIDAERERRE